VLKSFSDNDVEFEEMAEGDLGAVIAIEKKSFVAPWSKKVFRETLTFPLSFNIVAIKNIDNRVVGYANFYLVKGEVQVLNIAVAPAARKRGYATGLMQYAIVVLRERGAEEFFLEVRESNLDAINIYRKLGFRKIGRRKKYYTETNEDAIVMHLRVKE
jgi:ribosomal-protein-alanine N-acetyltransferase